MGSYQWKHEGSSASSNIFITSHKRVLRPRTPSFSRSHDSSRQQSFMISWAYESFTFKKPNLFITKEKFSVQTLDGMKYIVMSITKLYRRKMKSKILLKGLPRMNKLPLPPFKVNHQACRNPLWFH